MPIVPHAGLVAPSSRSFNVLEDVLVLDSFRMFNSAFFAIFSLKNLENQWNLQLEKYPYYKKKSVEA